MSEEDVNIEKTAAAEKRMRSDADWYYVPQGKLGVATRDRLCTNGNHDKISIIRVLHINDIRQEQDRVD